MGKIFFFIFNFCLLLNSDSISKPQLLALKKNSLTCYENKDYNNCIDFFQKLIQYSDEPRFKLFLAVSLFKSNTIEIPEKSDDIFLRNAKIQKIKNHYALISNLLTKYLEIIEERKFKDPNITEYYFLLGLSNYYSGENKKAIYYFMKIKAEKKYTDKIKHNLSLILEN